ncbi:MAG: class I adenylate-forming enzyme family protein [Sphingobium sp.]
MSITTPAPVPPGPDCKATLPAVLRQAVAAHGDKELFVSEQRRVSFAEAERESAELARGLIAMGVGKGTRIGLLMENAPDWPICFFAAARVGALVVTLSTFYQASELSWAMRHNDIDTLLISARFLKADYAERLERALPGLAEQQSSELYLPEHPYLRRIVMFGECDRRWATGGKEAIRAAAATKPQIDDAFLEQVEANIAPADDLIIICTSGSTAEPKAVLHTHGVTTRISHEFLDFMDMRPGDRSYSGQPLFWIGGINVNLMPCLLLGATLCFARSPAPDDVIDLIETEKVTRLSMWAAQVHGILERGQGRDLSSVRTGWLEPRDPFGDVIPADRRMASVMGMTESFGMHSIDMTWLPTPVGKGGHWGRHVRGMERRIIDPETQQPCPPGVEGELYVRGFSMMRGYYKKEREETFTRDGWFATGDLAYIDADDYIFFTGRRGELIKTSGANVAPREVELALQRYTEIREAIVFGLPDPVKGEIVVAVLIAHSDHAIDPAAITARLRNDISPYKVPSRILVMGFDDIPRTGSQKPQKPQLKSIVLELLEKH